jgi:hypothetical protein
MLHVKPLLLHQQTLKVVEAVAVVDSPVMNKVRNLHLGAKQMAACAKGPVKLKKSCIILIVV